MIPFIHAMTEPSTSPVGDGLNAVFNSNWRVAYGKYTFLIPEGFQTDFNSVPRGLWNILPPYRYPRAGFLHDWLYASESVSRAKADEIYRNVIQVLDGCPAYAAWIRWAALRAFGWLVWRRHDRQQVIWWRIKSGYRLEDFPLDKSNR